MSNTIFITANWTTGALSQQTISRQYDNNRYAVQFIGYPEGDGTEELDLYLLVWMSTAPGQKPGEITPIQLNSDQWYISNYFTQQVQVIKFQLCVLNEAGTYEAHSPIFSGRIGDSLEHDGTSHDIDVSTLFDAYREYVEELIIRAGAVVIDPTLTQSGQAADAKVVGDNIYQIKEIPAFPETFGTLSPTDGRMTGADTKWKTSDFLNVVGIKKIEVTTTVLATGVAAIAFYDFGKRFISAIKLAESKVVAYGADIPSNALYVRVSTVNNSESTAVIYKDSTKGFDFLNDKINSMEERKEFVFKDGIYVKFSNGTNANSSDWKATDFLSVNLCNAITIYSMRNTAVAYVAFYNSAYAFISAVQPIAYSEFTVLNSDFPTNAQYFKVCISAYDANAYAYYKTNKNGAESELDGKIKYMCFGDSITSDEVCGIGTMVAQKLNVISLGNFAHGNATLSDYYTGDTNESVETPDIELDRAYNANVLSNQVRNALAYATPVGEDVKYTHPTAGEITLNTGIWTGTGSVSNVPDIIYIAVGTNDGNENTLVVDDADEVNQQSYANLTRCGFASSLRWAIETLLAKFPNAQIFVATPLHTADHRMNGKRSYEIMNMKADIIKNVCRFCSVNVIDAYANSGVSAATQARFFGYDGLHPVVGQRGYIAEYIAKSIKAKYISGGTS